MALHAVLLELRMRQRHGARVVNQLIPPRPLHPKPQQRAHAQNQTQRKIRPAQRIGLLEIVQVNPLGNLLGGS